MTKVLTQAALAHLSAGELQALHRKVRQDLAASAEGSAERAAALATLENVSRALRAKLVPSGPRF